MKEICHTMIKEYQNREASSSSLTDSTDGFNFPFSFSFLSLFLSSLLLKRRLSSFHHSPVHFNLFLFLFFVESGSGPVAINWKNLLMLEKKQFEQEMGEILEREQTEMLERLQENDIKSFLEDLRLTWFCFVF